MVSLSSRGLPPQFTSFLMLPGAFQTDGNWFQLAWPDSMNEPSIAVHVMELIPVVIAASIWGSRCQGQLVCFHSDNVAVVCDVSKDFSADKALIHLLRCLSFFAAFFRFQYTYQGLLIGQLMVCPVTT